MNIDIDELSLARALAKMLHRGQTDKAGLPYIEHVTSVASAFHSQLYPDHHTVAWLHDVLEDTPATLGDLRSMGFSASTLLSVDALTRREDEQYSRYIERIATSGDKVARDVKLADLSHNLSTLENISESQAQRYNRAVERLKESKSQW